jgi:hypothetical protein
MNVSFVHNQAVELVNTVMWIEMGDDLKNQGKESWGYWEGVCLVI